MAPYQQEDHLFCFDAKQRVINVGGDPTPFLFLYITEHDICLAQRELLLRSGDTINLCS